MEAPARFEKQNEQPSIHTKRGTSTGTAEQLLTKAKAVAREKKERVEKERGKNERGKNEERRKGRSVILPEALCLNIKYSFLQHVLNKTLSTLSLLLSLSLLLFYSSFLLRKMASREESTGRTTQRGRGRPRRGEERGPPRPLVRPERSIAIEALEPTAAGQNVPPDVVAWPLDGPGAQNFIVLHASDTHQQEVQVRDNVVIVDVRVWPPAIHVYDYRYRPIQPRWVTADGRWLCRRTVDVETGQEQGAYRRVYRRWKPQTEGTRVPGDVVQTAKSVVPQQQEYVELYGSLEDLLQGKQPSRSLLFPQQSTHDFPDYMAVVGRDNGIIAISSVLQMERGTSHPWWAPPGAQEFSNLDLQLPLTRNEDRLDVPADERLALHRARPVERPSERSYALGITYDNARTILVWNGRGFVYDSASDRWSQRYDFESTDLGMRVPYWSSVVRQSGDIFYVNNMTLRRTFPLDSVDLEPVEPEDRYAEGRSLPARPREPIFEEPFDGYDAAGNPGVCSVRDEERVEEEQEDEETRNDGENAIGRDGKLRLDDLHRISYGPNQDYLVLQRKPYGKKTLAYIYNVTSGSVIALRRRDFGINYGTEDVPFVRYFPRMRTRTFLRPRRRGRPRRADQQQFREVEGGFIALAKNKLVFLDALNAGLIRVQE